MKNKKSNVQCSMSGMVALILLALISFSAAAEAQVTIGNILIDGVKALAGDPLSATPVVSVTATATSAVTGRITLGGAAQAVTFLGGGGSFAGTVEITTALADGTYALTVEVFDALGGGATSEVVPLFVQTAEDLVVQGKPLNYPNPFDPGLAGATTTLAYTLSKASSISLSIHDLRGTPVAKMSFAAGGNGGRAGYNAVTWNGRSDAGQVAGNGIYVYLIIGEGKVLAKGKLMVLKR